MDVIFVAAGLGLLLGGGEGLVRGAVAFATRMRLPMAVVGAIVLGFGTSMPELLTSLSAALSGAPGIAIGNVLGSNIANILLILGMAALVAPIGAGAAPAEDRLWLTVATALGVGVIVVGTHVGRVEGALLLVALVVYIWRALARDAAAEPVPAIEGMGAVRIALYLAGGLGALIAGAWLLVEGATGIATAFGISETVIGLTVVAVGTSLPELATSLSAARRGEAELALGNVLGSNVFNIFAILGVTAALVPIPVPEGLSVTDLVAVAAAALALLVVLAAGRIGRGAGAAFVLAYAAYVAWLALFAA
ncbi:calcium/sodium antiporter [Roseibacterium sp. SDUM158017]|uniref:calcium/sodium antiporter n=1 Tax=Roseicyclus salinarum TaxID=3036773 RepID=UPI0024150D8F|nr:calcium/sodium antiporter [Roseibacterium sp. SDUM158017]MDG4647444.1 calcium/sodium antiporter [Roseibacterium sp. SDUM158017]